MAAVTTEMRTQVSQLYVALFGRAPDAEGLGYWVQQVAGGQTVAQVAQAMYDTTPARTYFPLFLTNDEIVTNFYTNVLGRAPDTEGKAYWAGQLATKTAGQVIADMIVAVTGYAGTDAAALVSQDLFNNKAAVAEYYGVTLQGNADGATAALNGITDTTDVSTDAAKLAVIQDNGAVAGETFTLTTGVDSFTGGSGNDTFNAPIDGTNTEAMTSFDSLDGAGGTDTLNIYASGGFTVPTSATVTGIEVANINADTSITVNASNWTGLTTLTVNAQDDVFIMTKGNATTVSVGGSALTVSISDTATTDTLTTVSIDGNTSSAFISSDALTSLTLSNSSDNASVAAAAATRTLALTLNTMTGGTVTDGTATTLAVTTSGGASTGLALSAGAATAVSIAAGEKLTLTGLTANVATGLTVTGDSLVTLAIAGSTLGALTSINASGQTAGGLDIDDAAIGTGVAFTGGAGADAVQLGASTKATAMGAGDDSVLLTGAALGAAGTADGGDGTDTLGMTAANAATATGSATFEGTISGFERLALAASTTDTVALANLDDISYVSSLGATALTLTGMTSGGTLKYLAASTAATVTMVTAATLATDDVFNIAISNTAGVNAGTTTVANVETINLNTDDSAATATGIQHTAVLTAAAATKLVVSGDAGVALTLTGSAALASIDTSGVTKGAVALTTVADVATTFVGGATDTTVSLAGITTATKAGSITTGAGADNITGGAGADTIVAGDGANTIAGGGGADTITGGSGVDTITGGAGADKITGGAGADIFTYGATATDSNGVNQDTITDFVSGTDKIDTGTAATYLGEANGYGAVLTSLTGTAWDAVLDTSTSTLYIDINGDAALTVADITILLTGVTDLATGDFM